MNQITITHPSEWYENAFTAYATASGVNSYMFYNINNKVVLPANIDPSVFEYWVVPGSMPLTTLSYRIYGDMHLWWLIMITNQIINPIKLLAPGSTIRVIKRDYLSSVLQSIQNQQ